jgi:hypothetical protein
MHRCAHVAHLAYHLDRANNAFDALMELRVLRWRNITMLALALCTSAVSAQVEDRLADCARIAGSSERLACYDALSAAHKNTDVDWSWSFNSESGHSTAAEPRSVQPDTAANFGFDNAKGASDVEQIQSRYDGEFTGWSGNTLFRLENGQVWKQAQSGRNAQRATRPVVRIERTALGSYRMSVEGSSESVRVERVR